MTMKTISVKKLSTTSVSLFKAVSTLSNFVSVDNGASNTITAYLRRSLEAFTELAQLHKDLKHDHKRKKKLKLEANEVSRVNESRRGLNRHDVKETNVVDNFDGKLKNETGSEKQRHEKESEGRAEKENKKKRKSREIEDEGKNNSESQRRKKKIKSEGDS